MLRNCILAIALVLVVTNEARAQRAPDMATLDRGDGISKLGLDAGLSFVDVPYDLALRLELYGQYVARSGFGIYGSLPLTTSFGAPSDDEDPLDEVPDDATALGNLELGGLYVITQSQMLSYVFHLGVSFPTATEGRDESATLFSGVFPRFTDGVNTSGFWYARLGFSPLLYVDKLFLRFDLGFDIALEDTAHVLRFNLGGGVDLGPVALSLELCNSVSFINDSNELDDVLAFTVRFMGERFQPYLAVGAPIDELRDVVPFFIAGGLQFVP